MLRALTAALAIFSAANVDAGDALAGTLTQPTFMSDGVVLVHSSGARTGHPPCVADIHRFAVDATTPAGKAQLAGLLAAYSAGLQVVGTGASTNCLYGEWISYFYIVE